jgi:crotonobetainyl-CoA:carnitine CoA-transferase CaiB-like acyl-CoA transferase
VLVEGFRPGVMDRLGVGYETLAALNPKLVFCSITGYGQSGPYRDEPGHDLNYCALAGVSDQIGRAGDAPALSNVPVADLLGGSLTAAMGLLAALFDAQRTGRGRHVDISIADSTLAHAVVPMVSMLKEGSTRPAGTDKLSGGLACYGLYRTNDGRHLAVGALERKFWDAFCQVLGREDLKPRHLPADAAATQALRAELAEIIASQPLAHWRQRFEGTGCCVTPVLRLEEALDDRHFRARGMVVEPPDGGPRQLACPVKMSDYRFELRRVAPRPGEHSDEILAEAGYGTDELATLRKQGVVG